MYLYSCKLSRQGCSVLSMNVVFHQKKPWQLPDDGTIQGQVRPQAPAHKIPCDGHVSRAVLLTGAGNDSALSRDQGLIGSVLASLRTA